MSWAVSIESVGKRYQLGEREQYDALRDVIGRTARRMVGRGTSRAEPRTIWALRDVSAEIRPGEIVGLIGRNGAGKSTLLKIISRVTGPTEGRIQVRGGVGSLLEVGAGFHPELTGVENVYLNGSILGMRRREIDAKLDEIIDFSELAPFMSTPVKRYSVGMYMRLAFTVAAHLETEVLAVDEVLAVGDERFRRKCLGKINDVARAGRTVLFVSHDLDVTTRLCDRCLLLEEGRLLADGPAHDVATTYLSLSGVVARIGERTDLSRAERSGSGEARITAVTVTQADSNLIDLLVEVTASEDALIPSVGITVTTESGVLLSSVESSRLAGGSVTLGPGSQSVRLRVEGLSLAGGRYRIGLRLADPVTTRIGSGAIDLLEPAFIVPIHSDEAPGRRDDSLLATSLRLDVVPPPVADRYGNRDPGVDASEQS